MRRRIVGVALVATLVAVTAFGVPLAVTVQRLVVADEQGELEALALRGALAVSPGYLRSGDPVELPHGSGSVQIGLYSPDGKRVTGSGPSAADATVGRAESGSIATADDGDSLVAAVPVSVGERVTGVVRTASPRADVVLRTAQAWAVMLVIATLAVVGATLLASRQARRLTLPLERLETAASDLGAGNFGVRSSPSGIGELDRAGAALDRTAIRLGELVDRERRLATHASHQLRTPLTSLRLRLESALQDPQADLRAAAAGAVVASEQLAATIDDVVALARRPAGGLSPLDVRAVLDDEVRLWNGPFAAANRPLRSRLVTPPNAYADEAVVRQVLHVLLDNALRHGRGAVDMIAREATGVLAIDVQDEGRWSVNHSQPRTGVGGSTQLGLPMARELAASIGGRLAFGSANPTRVTLYLAATEGDEAVGDNGAPLDTGTLRDGGRR